MSPAVLLIWGFLEKVSKRPRLCGPDSTPWGAIPKPPEPIVVTGWPYKGIWELLEERNVGTWKATQAVCCYRAPLRCRNKLWSRIVPPS